YGSARGWPGAWRTPVGAPSHLPEKGGMLPSALPARSAPTQVRSLPGCSTSAGVALAQSDGAASSAAVAIAIRRVGVVVILRVPLSVLRSCTWRSAPRNPDPPADD